jgi:alpha-N-arabinofuranosidase
MNRRTFTYGITALPFLASFPTRIWATAAMPAATARVTIDPRQEIGRIDPKVYGHFLEHLERVIYGGVFDPGSAKSDAEGIRQDVVAAIRQMGGAQVLRWPGGNFASYYHWQDGIGPVGMRPRRYDVTWKNWESNQFGTDEYLTLCRELACEPFLTANLGDGTLREACEWVEYTRMQHRNPPVKIWGLGNEHYGAWQVGHYTAQEYGCKAQQFGQFMRTVSPDLQYIGVGYSDPAWNEAVLAECGSYLDWLSLHHYTHRYFLDGVDDFDSTVAAAVDFERALGAMSAQLDELEPKMKRKKPLEICLEEWNGRHMKRAGDSADSGEQLLRESPRNIVDALFVAGVFHACQRLSRRVTMTNYVFLVNAHGPLMVYPNGVLKSALFDVFRLYATVSHPVAVAAKTESETFHAQVHPGDGDVEVTAERIDAAATRSVDGRHITVSLINRYRDRACRIQLQFAHGRPSSLAQWHLLRADSLTEINTLENPDRVRSHSEKLSIASGYVDMPPASVGHLELDWN